MQKKITKSAVDALKPGEEIRDSVVKGFGVRCQKQAKVYHLQTRVDGRQRKFKIGEHGSPWTADTARKEAKRILGEIASGKTVSEIRPEKTKGSTLKELGEKYLADYAVHHKKPRSVKSDISNLNNHVFPLLGKKQVDQITTEDIAQFLRAVASGQTANPKRALTQRGGSVPKGGKGVSNRCRALLSKMFNLAEDWGWLPPGVNPVTRTKPFSEQARAS